MREQRARLCACGTPMFRDRTKKKGVPMFWDALSIDTADRHRRGAKAV
jgi:hypothetical protein